MTLATRTQPAGAGATAAGWGGPARALPPQTGGRWTPEPVDDNLGRLCGLWAAQRAAADEAMRGVLDLASGRATALRVELATSSKSIGWRVRALIGPRRRWYDLPEEVRAPPAS